VSYWFWFLLRRVSGLIVLFYTKFTNLILLMSKIQIRNSYKMFQTIKAIVQVCDEWVEKKIHLNRIYKCTGSHGLVTKIYYFKLFCASEGTLSLSSRLYLQSLAPTRFPRRVRCTGSPRSLVVLVSHRMGDQNLLFQAPPCFRRHVKPLILAAFAVVGTHSILKGWRQPDGRL
jgi:hypothetical protein